MKTILTVVVLYKSSIADSPTCQALQQGMQADPELAARMEVLLVDNSPAAQSVPAGFPGRYLHDGQNPGLARRYNLALCEAAAIGATWLQLLDQDTHLTSGYFAQVSRLSDQMAGDTSVVALVPKLVGHGVLQSPHLPVFHAPAFQLNLASHGVMPGLVRVYNSGALVRVQALEAIGGFPEAYWLDYLDHAIFAAMQARGGRVWLMDTQIEHEMSIHGPDWDTDPKHAQRHRNQLEAEVLFYMQYGSVREQMLDRLSLLRRAVGTAGRGLFASAGRFLRAAVWWPR